MDATVNCYQLSLIHSKGLCFIRLLEQATVVRGRAAEGPRRAKIVRGLDWDRLEIESIHRGEGGVCLD